MELKNFIAGATLLLAGVGSVVADTLYTYTGQAYAAGANPPYSVSMSLQGSMRLAAPLGASLTNVPIGPGTSYPIINWSFNDGVNSYTNSNSQIGGDILNRANRRFFVSTDGVGNITSWELFMVKPGGVHEVDQEVSILLIQSGQPDIVSASDPNPDPLAANTICSVVNALSLCSNAGGPTTVSSDSGQWSMRTVPPLSSPAPTAVPVMEWPGLLALIGGILGFAAWQRRRLT